MIRKILMMKCQLEEGLILEIEEILDKKIEGEADLRQILELPEALEVILKNRQTSESTMKMILQGHQIDILRQWELLSMRNLKTLLFLLLDPRLIKEDLINLKLHKEDEL